MALLAILGFLSIACHSTLGLNISINFSSTGKLFDGIGAISGGGAVARMLPLYPEAQQKEILDYLFKPGFGASLHILKVEIGGDGQSTEGVESSHRHYEWETPNNNRGYELFMIRQAKMRNPDIKLSALPWSFPGWLANSSFITPFADVDKTAKYVVDFLQMVKSSTGWNVDYIGVWNEKPVYAPYIKALYKLLEINGMENITKIVAADNNFEIIDYIKSDPELKKAVYRIGVHYPGSYAPVTAKQLGIPLWSSEDDSTDSRTTKSGCIARILNRNYVIGEYTSTTIWNIISAFYDNLPFTRTGLLTANQPWSGWYQVDDAIWMTAHTTQFTKPGWIYIKNGTGMLPGGGGSYVVLAPLNLSDFSLIIETVDFKTSPCVRPPISPYPTVEKQNVTFSLFNFGVAIPKKLHVRISDLSLKEEIFVEKPDIEINSDNTFTINISPNQVISISSFFSGKKGHLEEQETMGPGPKQSFPFPYSDNFDDTPVDSEGKFIQQQVGVFEVRPIANGNHKNALKQMMLQPPVSWCFPSNPRPLAVWGDYAWENFTYSADILIPKVNGSKSAYIAGRVQHGGCTTFTTNGIFVWVNPLQSTVTITETLLSKSATCSGIQHFNFDEFYNLSFTVRGTEIVVEVNSKAIIEKCNLTNNLKNGFLGMGTSDFSFAFFDNITVK